MAVLEALPSLEESIKENEKLVHFVAKKFKQRATAFMIDYEDLISEGTIALMKAIQNFKPEYGFKFTTYAVPMIEGHLKRILRDSNPGPKFARPAKELAYKIDGTESVREIIEKFQVKRHIAEEALACKGKAFTIPIDKPIGNDDDKDLTIGDMIGTSEDFTSVEVDDFLQTLEQNYKTVITLAMKDKTQQEIADEVGCSQVHVSRMLGKLKGKYEEYLKGGNKKMPIITVEEYKTFKEEGLTDTQIAIQKNTSPNYLSILKKKWGLSTLKAPVKEKQLSESVSAKEGKEAEYQLVIKHLATKLESKEITIQEKDKLIQSLELKVAEYENISAACDDVENEISSLREELSKETREKKYAQAEYEKALDKLEEVAYKLNNQRNVIDLNIKKNERYEKENKAMRDLLALWI